jgi:tetratricopeptide (TPR) repeat protein
MNLAMAFACIMFVATGLSFGDSSDSAGSSFFNSTPSLTDGLAPSTRPSKTIDTAAARSRPEGTFSREERPAATTRTSTGPTTTLATTQRFTFEDKNYSIEIPALPWLITSKNLTPPAAQVGFHRIYPELYFLIIGEREGVEIGTDNERLKTTVIENMKRGGAAVTIVRERPMRVSGLDGICIDFRTQRAGQTFSHQTWVCAHNGYLYQLLGWSRLADEEKLHQLLTAVRDGFKLIAPDRVVHLDGVQPFAKYVSPHFGFTIDLKDAGWHTWPNFSHDMPSGETGMMHGADTFLTVVPITLPEQAVDLETVARGLIGIMNVAWADTHGVRRITDGPLEGYGCEFVREINGLHVDYHAKIVRGDGFAYMVLSWTSDPKTVAKLNGFIDSVKRPTTKPAALTAATMTETERLAHAKVYNQIALLLYGDHEMARAAAIERQATTLNPSEPQFAANEVQFLIETNAPDQALQRAQEHLKRLPDAPALLVKVGSIEAQRGHSDASIAAYRKAFIGNYENDVQFDRYVNVLAEANKLDEALAVVDDYLTHSHALTPVVLQAQLLARKGETDRAIELLKRKEADLGMSADLTGTLAQICIDAQRYNDGLDVAKRMISSGFDAAEQHYLLARAEVGLKWYRDAQTSLETALRKQPDFPRARDLLNYVTGMLGQGDSSAIRQPIEPVAIPEELTKLSGATTQPATSENYAAIYVKRLRAMHFEKSKDARTTDRRVIRILNRQGVQDFSTLQFTYDPLSEDIYVNELIVRDEKGAILFTGKSSDYYVVDRNSSEASQRRTLNIPVSGLRAGCTLDLTYTRSERRPTDQIAFDEWLFAMGYPTAESTLFISGDLDAIRTRAERVPEPRKLAGGLCWSMNWPTVYKWEPAQPDSSKFMSYVAIAPAKATWESEGRDYLDMISALLPPTDEAKKLATELTEGLPRPQDKVAAILRHLQQEYTYKAIEFGRRARIPLKTGEIIRNRYGDCKDHALLLSQLLESSGIPAQLALVRSGSDLYADLPSLDQFNHVIVYSPTLQRYFDCTDKDSDLTGGVPYALGGKEVLLLEKASPHLATIPKYPDGCSVLSTKRDVRVIDDSDAELRDHLSVTGYCAGDIRSYLRNTEPRERARAIERLLSDDTADLSVRELQVTNLDEPNRPLLLEMTSVIRRRFTNLGDQLVGSIPAPWERNYLQYQPLKRETPFMIRIPLTVNSTITFSAPEHMRLPAAPKAETKKDAFTDSSVSYAADGNTLRCEATVHVLPSSQPAEAYNALQQSREKLLSSLEPQLLLRRDSK